MPDPSAPCHEGCATLVDVVVRRAAERPDQPAFVFHGEEGEPTAWTYRELVGRAAGVARALAAAAAEGDASAELRGARAVLAYPPGLDFLAGFLGCLAAGVLPVPSAPPKPRRGSSRLDALAADCAPRFALTTRGCLANWQLELQAPAVRGLRWLPTDALSEDSAAELPALGFAADDVAFLQYTSGSTSQPRGVMVTHGNLLANLELIRHGFALSPAAPGAPPLSGVFWLPPYHDMGLIGGMLTPLYVGGTSHLLAPAAFLRRPLEWLRLLGATRSAISGAPNFGYQLCVEKTSDYDRGQVDLSHWRLAFCGAEPIDAATLQRFAEAFADSGFSPRSFYPCYGLAEATLLVTGGEGPAAPRVRRVRKSALARHRFEEAAAEGDDDAVAMVGCGKPLGDQEVRIVDPETRASCGPGEIGEIWIRGRSVAVGYWNDPAGSAEWFAATARDGETGFLRTGDLGTLHAGELFVTGRLKDMVIVRGRNLYPHDIERAVQQAHPALDRGAAFGVVEQGVEQLVAVHELRREHRRDDLEPVFRAARQAIVEEFEVDPASLVLLRPGNLPRTSSGKVQRSRCRAMYLAGELEVVGRWVNPLLARGGAALSGEAAATGHGPSAAAAADLEGLTAEQRAAQFRGWLHAWLAERLTLEADAFDAATPFAQLGVDSLTAVELIQAVEVHWGVQASPEAAWSCTTPQEMAEYLAEQWQGAPSGAAGARPAIDGVGA